MDLPFSLNEPKALLLLLTIPPVVVLGILSARARSRDAGRIKASIVVRAAILLLITLAIAGLQWVSSGGPLNVVFLVDESASVGQNTQQAALDYVQKAIASMGPDDRSGVVLFGEHAIVERALSPGTGWKPEGQKPPSVATNIAEAIQVGIAMFPEGGSRRLVLLSDGVETAGRAADLARAAGQTGVQLSVVPLGSESSNEVAVDRVVSPDSVPSGQKFDVQVLLKSTSDRAATVRLFDNGAPAGTQEAEIRQGNNQVTFNLSAGLQGFHVLSARVDSVDDRYTENNSASSYTIVRTPPTVLLVAGGPDDAEPLQVALKSSGVEATVVTPDNIPPTMDRLLPYDAVILANASADAIGDDAQTLLQSYVRDQGRGLIMVGGEGSYGSGGYLRSTLEEVLPVSMDVRTSEQRASLAMSFVVDKSGSMGRCHCGGSEVFNPSMRTEFGPSKIEIVKKAIAKATSLLNSSDQVGVVTFDDKSHDVVGMAPIGATGESQLVAQLQPVTAAGATNMYAGLQTAVDTMATTGAQVKHIVLLSDGWTQQADYSGILSELHKQGITLSTVGAGEGSGDLLKTLAAQGGGQFYPAKDMQGVPDILLKETVRLIGSYFVEESFRPLESRASPILRGLDTSGLPPLLGYNSTTIKPNADLVLRSPRGDPVLATWQYGLGRSVAWTPDAKGRWATEWVKWPQFSQFVGQMVGWTLPQQVSPGLDTTFETVGSPTSSGQSYQVRIESVDSAGAPRNFLKTTVVLTDTAQNGISVPIFQTAPGVYIGTANGLQQGVYSVGIEQRDPITDRAVAAESTGLAVPYPSEFRLPDANSTTGTALLGDLAQLGGGKTLAIDQPADAFSHDIESQPQQLPLWPWLLSLAIILFPIDVAIRRLTITRADVRRALRLPVKQHDANAKP